MPNLTDLDATDLSNALAERTCTAEEVMAETLAAIAARNPAVNALVSLLDPDALMAEARAADRADRRGWLHGIPMAIKDLYDAADLPTTQGSPLFSDTVAKTDAGFVRRLRAAGAIIIGKTNVPQFGLGSHSVNPIFGATRNPYDAGLSAGGSSGGAAAALAVRLVAVADGSDAMGSLRNPAAWNNVYGFRPTVGLVPGETADSAIVHRLSTLGPMARSPADLEALLTTMSDGAYQGAPAPKSPRLAWLGDWGGAYRCEAGILDLAETAIADMEALGWQIEAIAPPVPAGLLWDTWTDLRSFVTALSLGVHWREPQARRHLNPQTQWETARGLTLTAARIERAQADRQVWLAAAAQVFTRFDALLLPATQVWPFPIDDAWPQRIGGADLDTYHRWMEVMIPASLAGLPALALPAGFGSAGLPGGLQLIGPAGADGRLLALGKLWHAATAWPTRRKPAL
ncbi:MAG: amidase [Pseudomonadota bacterium]